MALTRFRADFYNIGTNLLHTSIQVFGTDEESALRAAKTKFGNVNNADPSGEFFRCALTPLDGFDWEVSEPAQPVTLAKPVQPVTLADVAAGVPVSDTASVPDDAPVAETKAEYKQRLQAELDSLNAGE